MFNSTRSFSIVVVCVLIAGLLTACGGDQAVAPQPTERSDAGNMARSEATPTSPSAPGEQTGSNQGANSAPTPQEASKEGNLSGIDLSKVDVCALLTREEAEAILGPLDWKAAAPSSNDPTFELTCKYDEWGRGTTPEKNLTVRVLAPKAWLPSFGGELEGEEMSLIPRQEVGFDSEPALRYDATHPLGVVLPRCKGELPCVIAGEGGEWFRLTVLMPDESALRLEIEPQNIDYAKQLARIIFERLPMK